MFNSAYIHTTLYTAAVTAVGDIPRLFPDLRKHISLKVVSSANTILPMFETVMQEKGLATLAAEGVDVVLNARVSAVRKGAVELQDGREIPYGLCFWAGMYTHTCTTVCDHACRAVCSDNVLRQSVRLSWGTAVSSLV
jgi:NADH dehydrogenase FAD-containing subunit